jgi:multisubunit Na+/H+ antiporter MnhB subunit
MEGSNRRNNPGRKRDRLKYAVYGFGFAALVTFFLGPVLMTMSFDFDPEKTGAGVALFIIGGVIFALSLLSLIVTIILVIMKKRRA